MTDATNLSRLLALNVAPVAVRFRDEAPDGVARVAGAAPSGCTYWSHASKGHRFYTTPEDHLGCPIGAHTHGIEVADEQLAEKQEMLETMTRLDYVRADEVPGIPTLEGGFGVAVYSSLDDAEEPDVVLVRGNARQMMMLAEAATAAGIATHATMGRPTCAAIPEAMATGACITNLACIGNRVYTELADDELYVVIPGKSVDAVVERLPGIIGANQVLESMHQERAG